MAQTTKIDLDNAALRTALRMAGERIRRLNDGRCEDRALTLLRQVYRQTGTALQSSARANMIGA